MLQLSSLSMRSTCDRNILRQQQRLNPSLSSILPTSTSFPASPFSSRSPTSTQNSSHLCAMGLPQLKQRTGMIIIILIFKMKPSLQEKIAKYKKEKSQKGNLQSFLAEKRKNIERLFEEQAPIEKENDFRIENYANQIDMKHQKYLEDMDELQNVRFRIIEVRGNYETLQLEMNMQEDNMAALRQAYAKEVASQEDILSQLRARMATEVTEKIKMEEQRCQKQLEYAEKLTNEKEELINRSEELLIKRKNMDLALKKLKDSFEEDYKKQREVWAKAEQQRRDKWQARKLQQISQNTLKGLEPQINRIVKESKREIAKIQEKYEQLRNQYQQEMNRQFQSNLKQIRKGIIDRAEEEKMYMLEKSNEQYRKLMDKLISTHQNQTLQLKCAKEAELRDLDSKRKRQSSEFMSKNKDYLMSHLDEVKQIKSNYQRQIRELDGSIDQLLWKEEQAIKTKYQRKAQSHREEKRKQLEGKVKSFHMQQKQNSESQYEDIVQKVAVENQVIQNNLRKQTQAKIREYKENNDAEMKTIRKNLQAMLSKEQQENQALANVKEVKDAIQLEHEELMRENEYLKKKELEYQAEIVQLKSKETAFLEVEQQDKNRVEKQWGEQLEMLEKKIGLIQEEIQTQQRIMEEKQEEERAKIRGVWSKLQKESLQFMKKLKDEIDRAKKQKAMKAALNAKLLQMKKKLKDMESKRRQTKL